MRDQRDVGLIRLFGAEHGEEVVVGRVGVRACRHQADALADAEHMAVNRHQRLVEAEHQHHGRGLLADSRDGGQPFARLERRHLTQELQRVATAVGAERAECGLDPRRLLVGQAAGADDVGEFGDRRGLNRRPIRRGKIREADAAPAWEVARFQGRVLRRGRRWPPVA